MAARNRSAAQREYHRAEIARRYLQGEQQDAIGRSLGLSQQMVSYDLGVLRERWRTSGLHDLDQKKVEELAKIDNLEREYWTAWENSKREKEKAKQESRRLGKALVKITSLQKEGQAGDPRFLEGVLKCIERRCKLLGIDAPEKLDVKQSGKVVIEVELLDKPVGHEG